MVEYTKPLQNLRGTQRRGLWLVFWDVGLNDGLDDDGSAWREVSHSSFALQHRSRSC